MVAARGAVGEGVRCAPAVLHLQLGGEGSVLRAREQSVQDGLHGRAARPQREGDGGGERIRLELDEASVAQQRLPHEKPDACREQLEVRNVEEPEAGDAVERHAPPLACVPAA